MLKLRKLALASVVCLNLATVTDAGLLRDTLTDCIDYTQSAGFDDFIGTGCVDGCCECGPEWEFSTSILYLNRDQIGDQVLVTGAGGGPALSTSDFDYDYEMGFEVAGKRTIEDHFISTRFFALDSLTTNRSAVIPGFGGNIVTSPLTPFGAGDLNGTYGSDLYSLEVNLGRVVSCDTEVYLGIRGMELGEALNVAFSTPPVFTVNSETDNYLYGLQAGGESTLFERGRFSIEGAGAAGIYWNHARSTVWAAQPPVAPTFGGTARDSDDMVAFSIEAALKAKYDLNNTLALFAGYQLQYLGGVALAPDQWNRAGNLAVGTATPVPTSVDSSDVIYHGFNFGLEATF
ncbi:BBP7 family outer membrane beta-barrel protein [Rubinisphaera margarita]|uniref:BBP7 family outer membrane beta-barrel protein n=1 Tax=Rubinisphaera margarita TaxID=2909586 RepID=UPI001EE7CDE9|nr:BBP7 family outer membrane beta-barrel protein [Rubinisphaera margarita]MCG6158116.1 BBP7 family outer membrane beta-barrel protein [Rubinisphaera margarita]